MYQNASFQYKNLCPFPADITPTGTREGTPPPQTPPSARFRVFGVVLALADKSRTKRPVIETPKLVGRLHTLRALIRTSFKLCHTSRLRRSVSRKRYQVTRPTNAETGSASYHPNGKAYELEIWYTDGARRPVSATSAVTTKVKGQGRKVTWRVWQWR